MTTEPKFIPSKAVEISVQEGINMRSVWWIVWGMPCPASSALRKGKNPEWCIPPGLKRKFPSNRRRKSAPVRSPTIPPSAFSLPPMAPSPIFPESYRDAEERVVFELKELNKPFVIVLNSQPPMERKPWNWRRNCGTGYNISVVPLDAANMAQEDVISVLRESLYEFPVTEVNVNLPGWIEELQPTPLAAGRHGGGYLPDHR